MGCDGGTIPRRDELVKTKKKAEVVSVSTFLLNVLHVMLSERQEFGIGLSVVMLCNKSAIA